MSNFGTLASLVVSQISGEVTLSVKETKVVGRRGRLRAELQKYGDINKGMILYMLTKMF